MRTTFPCARLAMAALATLAACGTPTGGRDGMPSGGPGSGSQGGSCKSPVELIRQQLSETDQVLSLTPKQRVLWDNYQESISSLMADQMKQESANSARRTAVQQINSKVDTVRNRLAAMEDVSDKAVMLYQSLDDAQKKIADLRLPATVPPLYSGLSCQGGNENAGERGKPGSGNRGGPGGAMGGGMGRF